MVEHGAAEPDAQLPLEPQAQAANGGEEAEGLEQKGPTPPAPCWP